MRIVLALLLATFIGTACTDDDADEPKTLPTCESVGCDNAFCDIQNVCTCNGESCMLCERSDAGVCTN